MRYCVPIYIVVEVPNEQEAHAAQENIRALVSDPIVMMTLQSKVTLSGTPQIGPTYPTK